jgi:hypothetical protein
LPVFCAAALSSGRIDSFYQIQERIADLSEGEETWPEGTKANAGVVIGIGHDGAAEIRRGLSIGRGRGYAEPAIST